MVTGAGFYNNLLVNSVFRQIFLCVEGQGCLNPNQGVSQGAALRFL